MILMFLGIFMSNTENKKSSFLPFMIGFLVGGTIGTIIGMILSPKSGAEIRYNLSDGVGDVQDKTKQLFDETKYNIGDKFLQSRKNLHDTVRRITDAFNAGRNSNSEIINEDDENKDS